MEKIKKHWDKLFSLLDQHPEWEEYLQDKGTGDAPVEYLVAVEEGLRNFGKEQAAFGKFAMDSLKEWVVVARFKKSECYIEHRHLVHQDFHLMLQPNAHEISTFLSKVHNRVNYM